MKDAVAAGTLLQQLLHQWGMERRLREYGAWQVWDEVVGPQIAARARPIRVRDGVLEVRVDQPVWMQQLQLMKPKILARLNERLGETAIRDIFWRRGQLGKDKTAAAPPRETCAWRSHSLSEAEISSIENSLAPVADPALRQGLRCILQRQARLAKSRRLAPSDENSENPAGPEIPCGE